MKTRVIHGILASLGMVLCAAVGLFAPPLWEGVSSRDFRPQATTTAILILALGITLRRGFRWSGWDLILGLAVTEVITLLAIAQVSGYNWLETFNSFNLRWVASLNLFIGLPWVLGLALGTLWLGLSEKLARDANKASDTQAGSQQGH